MLLLLLLRHRRRNRVLLLGLMLCMLPHHGQVLLHLRRLAGSATYHALVCHLLLLRLLQACWLQLLPGPVHGLTRWPSSSERRAGGVLGAVHQGAW